MNQDYVVIFSTLSLLIVVFLMIFLYIAFLNKKSKLILEKKENEIAFETELADSQVEIKEQTLTYIGRELHDDLGQKLSVVRLRSNQLATKLKDSEKKELEEINLLLGECIQDIRNLTKNLVSEQIEHFGLVDSLEREVVKIKKLNLIQIEFHTNNYDLDISSKHALILFRMIQESINNILKHSRAKKMEINIEDSENELTIMISDNGKGFDADATKDGSGLKNIHSRAKIINTQVSIISEVKKGAEITFKYKK